MSRAPILASSAVIQFHLAAGVALLVGLIVLAMRRGTSDHDDFGGNPSKVMNMIYFKI